MDCYLSCLSSFEYKMSHVAKVLTASQPSGHYMYRQFNIQQLYVLPTLYLCVSYLSENKQRIVSLTA